MTGRDDQEWTDEPASDDAGELALPPLDGEAGPATRLSEREQLLLVDRIERQFARQRRVLPWRAPRRVVVAGALFAASAAAAVYGVGVLTRAPQAPAPAQGPSKPSRSEATPPADSPADSPAEQPSAEQSSAGQSSAGQPLGLEPPPAAPRQEEPGAPEAALQQQQSANARPAEAQGEPRSLPSGTARTPLPRASGADRLAAASALRARHRYREALALYLQVIELDPNGVQASVARVAAAEVQLDHLGDIAGAERLYREAKTQGGELTAEAQFGLAQVARARGDATGERQALQDFLSRHPGSPLVSAARRRLSALGAR